MPKAFDITNMRFGKLVALRPDETRIGKRHWLCRCDCGNQTSVRTNYLRIGKTKSCGCVGSRAPKRRHGHAGNPELGIKKSPTYSAWQNMHARCSQPSNPAYTHYKRRGITVCDRWNSFENFLADMSERPGGFREYTLERIDNDKGYEPGNCRWATWSEQANNRTDNSGEQNPAAKLTDEQIIAIRADTRTQAQIAKDYGVRQQHISRIKNGKRRRMISLSNCHACPGRARFDPSGIPSMSRAA